KGSEAYHAYRGEGLDVFHRDKGRRGETRDLIADVMVPAKKEIGSFGNVARKFLYRVGSLDQDFVQAVQALTEQATQQNLSVKAGRCGLRWGAFKKHILEPLLTGSPPHSDCGEE